MQFRLFDKLPDQINGIQLREYQRAAVAGVLREWSTVQSTLGIAFTGAGKTTIASQVAKLTVGRGLFLANRDFLLDQMRERVEKMTSELVSVEKAAQRMDSSRMVVGSIQTLRGRRLERIPRDTFDWIIYDEAHHAASNGSRAIFEHFERAKRFGITATPERLDGVGMWNAFETVAFNFGMDFGMGEGFFLEPVPVARFIDSVNLSGVATAQGDLALGQLEAEIVRNAAKIAQVAYEDCGDYQTIVYTPGVASAHAVAATLVELGRTAVAVDQDTPKDVRRDILRKFESREIQYICNCAIYVEGLDCPGARAIVIARPTKSESLYKQMAGRGGRPEGWIGQLPTAADRLAAIRASGKPNFLLLDITGHAGRHSLVSSVAALAGKEAPEVTKRAAKISASNAAQGKTLAETIEQAKEEIDMEDKATQRRLAEAAAAAEVKSRREAFDPFRKLGASDEVNGEAMEWASELPTADDLKWLTDNRLTTKNVTRATVQKLRRQARDWSNRGMASFRQRRVLASAKAPVDVSFATASRLIDQIVRQGYRPLTAEQVAYCVGQRVPGEDG